MFAKSSNPRAIIDNDVEEDGKFGLSVFTSHHIICPFLLFIFFFVVSIVCFQCLQYHFDEFSRIIFCRYSALRIPSISFVICPKYAIIILMAALPDSWSRREYNKVIMRCFTITTITIEIGLARLEKG